MDRNFLSYLCGSEQEPLHTITSSAFLSYLYGSELHAQ
ncbi:hypothetical protein [Acinetobacter bereziniae]|nr:hypothetical protein [Acinetobacter bereziniae]